MSYRELVGLAAGASGWLDELGVGAGSAVAGLFNTTAEAMALMLAGACTGRPLASLGPRMTAREIAGCLSGLDSPVLVSEPQFADVGSRAAELAGRRHVVLDGLPAVGDREPVPVGDPDAVVAILHTSGTTGAPKQVPIRQRNLTERVGVSAELMGISAQSVYASGSPFYHIAGLGNLVVMVAAGAAIVPFSTFNEQAWRGLGELRVTHAFLVPTMIERLLEAGALSLGSLELLQYGSSPIRPETLRRAVEALPGVRFINMFGQTEGSPIACLTPADHLLALEGRADLLASVGRAAPGVELKVDSPDETGVGEVLAQGAHLFKPGEDGWLRTGDLGRLDEQGYLYLVGRLGDRIKRGGENVHPVEVEDVLLEHAAVREAAVVGVPDDRLGQSVKAFIVLQEGKPRPGEEELRSFARERLSGYKVPANWEFVTELPRNPTGKLLRRRLTEQ